MILTIGDIDCLLKKSCLSPLRYGITHPVFCDSSIELWRSWNIFCWPTFVLLKTRTDGQPALPLFVGIGESCLPLLDRIVASAFHVWPESKALLQSTSLELFQSTNDVNSLKKLWYPGKVEASEDRLIISDTGHHRLIITDFDGNVERTIGSGERGSQDGSLDEAQFNEPNGVCRVDDRIFIADTGNNAIRLVDLNQRIGQNFMQDGEFFTLGHCSRCKVWSDVCCNGWVASNLVCQG